MKEFIKKKNYGHSITPVLYGKYNTRGSYICQDNLINEMRLELNSLKTNDNIIDQNSYSNILQRSIVEKKNL